MPVFSHVLILKAGNVLAAGEKSDVLTTKNLLRAFDAKLKLQLKAGRCMMEVSPKQGGIV